MSSLSRRKRVTWGLEEAEVLSDFLVSVFAGKCSSHAAQFAEGKGRNWEREKPPPLGEDRVRDHLRNRKAQKSVGRDEMCGKLMEGW